MSPLPAYRYAMPSAVIVGAGVFGSSLARQLAINGWEVTLVEQESPGWAGSSSGGESRLVRFAHGTDSWYTRSAWHALDLWRAIDPTLLTGCGLAWFAYGEQGWEADSLATMRAEGIPAERLEPADVAELFPSLGTDDVAWVLYEPDACVVLASRACGVLVEQAREAGAQIVRARAEPAGGRGHLQRDEASNVCFADDLLEADHVIWSCGPWLPKLFPTHVHVRPTLQEVVFFE